MKYIQENLIEYENDLFFAKLYEEAEEVKEMSPADKQKKKEELQKLGMKVVQKCVKNFKTFKTHAGSIWQEYRDFWSTQQDADESVDQKGLFYNMWKSDYIVGVVKEPQGHAALKVFDTSADTDDYIVFQSKNPEVVKAFKEFVDNDLKATIKGIIQSQRDSMKAKKAAEAKQQKEETEAAKQEKINKFLGESKQSTSKKN